MACSFITKGRKLPVCKNNLGGLKAIGFLDFVPGVYDTLEVDGTFSAASANYVFTATTGTTVFQYELKNDGNTFTETGNSDPNNYTTIYTSEAKLVLAKLTQEDINNIKLLAFGRPQLFIEFNNGQIAFVGVENGANLATSVKNSGGNKKDLQSIELTFQTEERIQYSFLSPEAIAMYKLDLSASKIEVG